MMSGGGGGMNPMMGQMIQAMMQQKMMQQAGQQRMQQQAGQTALQGQDPGYDPMQGNPNGGGGGFMQAMASRFGGMSPGSPYSGPMASGGGAFPMQYGAGYQTS